MREAQLGITTATLTQEENQIYKEKKHSNKHWILHESKTQRGSIIGKNVSKYVLKDTVDFIQP